MGTTSRADLRYPEQGDENNVPLDIQELAEDVDDELYSAYTCTSSTRPAGVAAGFLIYETDTDLVLVYDGSGWIGTGSGGSGGGGGGGSAVGGRWSAGSTAQTVPNTTSGPGTILAFGTAVSGSGIPAATGVTRTTEGAGHKFELDESGIWSPVVSARVASASAAGEISLSVWADLAGGTTFNYNVDADGARREGLPRSLRAGKPTYLPAGTTLVAYLYNGTGTTRTLEPNAGNWVHFDIWRVG
jgi:hypothetical protein